ncbi:cytochrome P450 [Ilumatobacter sp.]|uniref:cytochrome P450 n=1 Tax=Ilumatobacter sp. TaxID=1967498 RepID=UPI003C4E94E2
MTLGYEVEADEEPLPAAGYRTYEVFQRERVGETTNLLSPRELIGDEMLADPTRLLTVLRENYPCYRDWKGNRFWITRYDDVTSVFADEANFETRSKRWSLSDGDIATERLLGRDLGAEVAVATARAGRVDAALNDVVERVVGDISATAARGEPVDLATEFAARIPLELWGAVLDLTDDELPGFASRYWKMQRGVGWDPQARLDGRRAFDELVAFFEPIVERRRAEPSDDLISAIIAVDPGEERPDRARDLVATILEADHETLHGGVANMWCQLLLHPDQLQTVRDDPRMMKFAWLETLRHSPPVHGAQRFARHEVERFGRLLPDGALLELSAAAANRDPRVFDDPDAFIVGRKDLCQREPRGQYRADGLPSGIAFGLGRPSIHPAVPKDRPRSNYAITSDIAVAASRRLLTAVPDLRLADGATPTIRSLRLGEMHTCWHLPATTGA